MTTGNDGQQQNRSRTTHLRVRFHGKRGARVLSVFCPHKLKIVDTIKCNGCEHGLGLTFNTEARALFMACGWPPNSLELPAAADSAESTLASLLIKPVECVAQDAELEGVLGAFVSGGIDAAPVVDHDGRAVGILSKGDLLRWYCARPQAGLTKAAHEPISVERSATPRVREAMSHIVYTLHAEADIARAAALMAYEGVHQIVITNQDGRPVGLVSSLDILRCIAHRNGYVMLGTP